MKKFDFIQAIEVILLRHGATQEGSYGWQLTTRAGLLDIKPYDNWVACRFYDPAAAATVIPCGSLNRCSGKWNWHYTKPTQLDADFLEKQFVALVDPVAEAAIHPLERASRKLCAYIRASGTVVTIDSGGDSDEYIVVFPPNRRSDSGVQS